MRKYYSSWVKNGLLFDSSGLGGNNNSAEEEVFTKIPHKLAKRPAMGGHGNAGG
jgi:hypothetical protein